MPRLLDQAAARLVGAISLPLLLADPAMAAPASGGGGVPALYPTRAEAENAARLHFNCTGAHRMGNQWMPCDRHADAHGSQHTH